MKIGWDNDAGLPKLVRDAVTDTEEPLRDAILAFLPTDSPAAKTKQEIMVATGKSDKAVRGVLADLLEQLEIACESRGEHHTKHYWTTR